jgi:hypothetical protein
MTALLSPILAHVEPGMVEFRCPGCRHTHAINITPDAGRPCWTYNGNPDAPTFNPSILVRGKQTVQDDNYEWTGEWVTGPDGKALDLVCHSFVVDGRIQYLGDCTHALANQTIDLPAYSAHGHDTIADSDGSDGA